MRQNRGPSRTPGDRRYGQSENKRITIHYIADKTGVPQGLLETDDMANL